MNKFILIGFCISLLLILLAETSADLSCEVTTSCTYTDIFHISNLTNAHAELNNNSNYNQIVCCRDTDSIATLGTGNTGNYSTLLHLSTETNAHVELNNASNYPLFLYLNTSNGNILCAYAGNCIAYNTCIASVSTEFTGDSNLHIADCVTNPYATKICCNLTTAANNVPVINDISNIPSQSITEDSIAYVDFSVLASDQDGVSQLNDNSLNTTFFLSGEDLRYNLSCAWIQDLTSTQANYSCRIGILYWDAGGTWNVNATILDTNNAISSPYNETFVLGSTTSMKMSPGALTWPTLNLGSTNSLATNFIIINNSGNIDITSNNVRVNAVNLTGEANSNYFIRAGNFSSNVAQACEGTQLVEATATGVTSSILAAGNHSIMNNATGQEVLFFCAETIPSNIIVQAYSTNKTGKTWTVDVYS